MISTMGIVLYVAVGMILAAGMVWKIPQARRHSALDMIVMIVVVFWPALLLMVLSEVFSSDDDDE